MPNTKTEVCSISLESYPSKEMIVVESTRSKLNSRTLVHKSFINQLEEYGYVLIQKQENERG